MKNLIFIFVFLFLCSSTNAKSVFSLIRDGKLQEAADSISARSTASSRNGDYLYFSALLETDGDRSAQLLSASLNASVSPLYKEDIFYRLAQYYFIKGQYTRLSETIAEYRSRWEDGKHTAEMIRYSIMVDQSTNQYDAAIKHADRLLIYYRDGVESQFATIDKARVMLAFGKRVAAHELLKRTSRAKEGPGVPQALYLLGLDAVSRGRTDDAVFYYNILREAYPYAVGLESMIESMMNITHDESSRNKAEKLTGTYYSIQVGVFKEKKNASRMADRFKPHGKKVELKQKTVSGRRYHVVYVGQFSSYQKAADFKTILETQQGEMYQVVPR